MVVYFNLFFAPPLVYTRCIKNMISARLPSCQIGELALEQAGLSDCAVKLCSLWFDQHYHQRSIKNISMAWHQQALWPENRKMQPLPCPPA
jgi:hypothetical protein